MANGGVIGRVSQVNENSSKVSLLSSDKGIDAKIPVRLGSPSDPVNGLLASYDDDQNAYVVTSLVGKVISKREAKLLLAVLEVIRRVVSCLEP